MYFSSCKPIKTRISDQTTFKTVTRTIFKMWWKINLGPCVQTPMLGRTFREKYFGQHFLKIRAIFFVYLVNKYPCPICPGNSANIYTRYFFVSFLLNSYKLSLFLNYISNFMNIFSEIVLIWTVEIFLIWTVLEGF
jgi:hypothetical protein